MQNEDNLRGLTKTMDFMRAIAILFTVINGYWFCYEALHEWKITISVADTILMNFHRTTGLFSSILILFTSFFAFLKFHKNLLNF